MSLDELIAASRDGKQTTVESLIRGGVDVNGKTKGGLTPLHWAVIRGNLGVVKALLASGADVNAATPSGMTPVDEAVERGRMPILKVLEQHGVDLRNQQNSKGDCPIHVASREGYLEMVKWLVEDLETNVALKNKDGKTGLDIARESPKKKDVIEYLFDKML